jgi:type II restriction enzyme
MLNAGTAIRPLWQGEKVATGESIAVVKEEALTMLAQEREEIMRMSREEAIRFLIQGRNIGGSKH